MRRAGYLLVPLLFLAILVIAHHLTPDPSGVGTHRELGLPPCYFLKLTGIICPSCGLTTSFAWMARGNFTAAFHAHPLGPLILLLFAWVSLISLLEFFERGNQLRAIHQKFWMRTTFGGCFLFLGVWIFRVAFNFYKKG